MSNTLLILRREITKSLLRFASMGIAATFGGLLCGLLVWLGMKYEVAFILTFIVSVFLAYFVWKWVKKYPSLYESMLIVEKYRWSWVGKKSLVFVNSNISDVRDFWVTIGADTENKIT